uniref:Uncharacterized protein n=1 Tax=Magallana gigas TaxID=29159 RepID=K1PWF6_MAGGI
MQLVKIAETIGIVQTYTIAAGTSPLVVQTATSVLVHSASALCKAIAIPCVVIVLNIIIAIVVSLVKRSSAMALIVWLIALLCVVSSATSSCGSAMALIVWLIALLCVVSSATSSCDTPVMFSENSTKYPFWKEPLILNCTASSYDQINWYHVPVGTTDLNPYQFSWCTPNTCRLRGNSTILIMREISMELKHSKIICVASCSATGKNATAYTTVLVQECVTNRPKLKQVQNVTTSLGETANLTCKAEMGTCYDLTSPNFIWAGNRKNISELNTTNRYSTYVELDVTGELVTTLTIRDVKEEDLQSFNCILVDNHFRAGNDRMTKRETFHLTEKTRNV